jgi:hypothetical protein
LFQSIWKSTENSILKFLTVSSVSSDSIVKGIIDDIIKMAVKTAEVDEQKNKIFTTFYYTLWSDKTCVFNRFRKYAAYLELCQDIINLVVNLISDFKLVHLFNSVCIYRGHCGRGRMVVGFTTTYAALPWPIFVKPYNVIKMHTFFFAISTSVIPRVMGIIPWKIVYGKYCSLLIPEQDTELIFFKLYQIIINGGLRVCIF